MGIDEGSAMIRDYMLGNDESADDILANKVGYNSFTSSSKNYCLDAFSVTFA